VVASTAFSSVSVTLVLGDELFTPLSVPVVFEDELFTPVSVTLVLEDGLFSAELGALADEPEFLVSLSCCCFLLARSRANILLKASDPDGSFIGPLGVGLLGVGRLLLRMGMLCI
jgi:hypothetical protein